MKLRKLSLVLLASMMAFVGVGCSSDKEPQVSTEQTTQIVEPEVSADQVTTPETNQAAFPVTLTDSNGVEVTVAEEPMRIVSLAPSTTEILHFLGVEDKVVGRTKYCSYPETLVDVPEVGGTSDPNIEAIMDLNPDLIVSSTHTDPEIMAKLNELNIPTAFLNEQEGFEGTYAAIRNIGLLVGQAERAETVVEEMQASVEATTKRVAEATADGELPKVYYMMWYGDSDSTAGGDTFIGELIRLAGGINIAEDVSGWSITKEVIAEQDPDIIILPTGTTTLEELQATPFYQDLRAVKDGNLFEVDKDMISRQAPRVVQSLADLAAGIHPETAE